MGFAGLFTLLPMVVLFAAFIFGSVLARRGEKSWRTLLMLTGSISQVTGFVFVLVSQWLAYSQISMHSGGSHGATSLVVWRAIAVVSALLVLGGMVVFAIAFVAYCARAGAAGKRAEELEEMLGHLQQRIAVQDRI